MISLEECTKILNSGDVKFVAEEVKQIRDLMIALAVIEYEEFSKQKSKERKPGNLNQKELIKAA